MKLWEFSHCHYTQIALKNCESCWYDKVLKKNKAQLKIYRQSTIVWQVERFKISKCKFFIFGYSKVKRKVPKHICK